MNDWQIVNDQMDFIAAECPHCDKSKRITKKELQFNGIDSFAYSNTFKYDCTKHLCWGKSCKSLQGLS